MLIIFGFIFISLFIGYLVFLDNCSHTYNKDDKRVRVYNGWIEGFTGFLIAFVVLLVLTCIIWGKSYSTYLDLQCYRNSEIPLQKEAIQSYKNASIKAIGLDSETVMTDMKFQGYQQEVAKMIDNLKKTINLYNNELITKRRMKSSPVFSWLIFGPDPYMDIISINPDLVK